MSGKYAIHVTRLWLESGIGLKGWIGAELTDGTLVALCSVEKWETGGHDSLRRDWRHNERTFFAPKTIWMDVSEAELRADGLGRGVLRMRGLPY